MKTCPKCKETKSEDQFYKNARTADGLVYICRRCFTSIYQTKREEPKRLIDFANGLKTCGSCKKLLALTNFYTHKSKPIGTLGYYGTICKKCADRAKDIRKLKGTKDAAKAKELLWRVTARTKGLCLSCGESLQPEDNIRCQSCLEKRRTRQNEINKQKRDLSQCARCNEKERTNSIYCDLCNLQVRKQERALLRNLRLEAVQAYGGKCECCGEENYFFLTFDHVNRDGAKERKEGKTVGAQWLRRIIKNKREDLRLLCYNCNCARERNEGVCPHKEIMVLEEFLT